MATPTELRRWNALEYADPDTVLAELDAEPRRSMPLGHDARLLRARETTLANERRAAAQLFRLLGLARRQAFTFALAQKAAYDWVGRYTEDGATHFLPVQVKTFVPDVASPSGTLQGVVDSAKRRFDQPTALSLAIDVSRADHIDPAELDVQGLCVDGLWLFGRPGFAARSLMIGNLLAPDWTTFVQSDAPPAPPAPADTRRRPALDPELA